MKVYLVQEICDDEHGCRTTIGVYSSLAQAKILVDSKLNYRNDSIYIYDEGEEVPVYIIEEWELNGECIDIF